MTTQQTADIRKTEIFFQKYFTELKTAMRECEYIQILGVCATHEQKLYLHHLTNKMIPTLKLQVGKYGEILGYEI